MSQDSSRAKIKQLEERIEQLERFMMNSLVFCVEDLAEAVNGHSTPNARTEESAAWARKIADKARVAGFDDNQGI